MYKIIISSLFSLLLIIPSIANADCPDSTVSCSNGAVGWHGNSWNWEKVRCERSGHNHCPTPPSANQMPHKSLAQGARFRNDLLSEGYANGCSWNPTDPASKSFKGVFRGACDEHDICYTTPGESKRTCDNNFEKNMAWSCTNYYIHQTKSKILNASQLGLCHTAAPFWKAAVVLKGGPSYIGDQKAGNEVLEEAKGWQRITGAAIDMGNGWLVGTNNLVYRYVGGKNSWKAMNFPGKAYRIGSNTTEPLVVDLEKNLWRFESNKWKKLNVKAIDAGDNWILSPDEEIFRLNHNRWVKVSGRAMRVSGTYETPWLVSRDQKIWMWNSKSWNHIPGRATDVGDGWVVSKTERIYKYLPKKNIWHLLPNAAANVIGGTYKTPWVISSTHKIYKWKYL